MPLDLTALARLMVDRSISEVARESGISRPHLSRLIAGAWNPTLRTLDRLAQALGVETSALLR